MNGWIIPGCRRAKRARARRQENLSTCLPVFLTFLYPFILILVSHLSVYLSSCLCSILSFCFWYPIFLFFCLYDFLYPFILFLVTYLSVYLSSWLSSILSSCSCYPIFLLCSPLYIYILYITIPPRWICSRIFWKKTSLEKNVAQQFFLRNLWGIF